jgi:hypothetical protein
MTSSAPSFGESVLFQDAADVASREDRSLPIDDVERRHEYAGA